MTFPLFKNANRDRLARVILQAGQQPEVILADQVRAIVAARFVERRAGIVTNEADANLADEVTVSVLRTRGLGIPIVRVNGVVVLHQWDGTFERGEWESVVASAAAELETEQMPKAA